MGQDHEKWVQEYARALEMGQGACQDTKEGWKSLTLGPCRRNIVATPLAIIVASILRY